MSQWVIWGRSLARCFVRSSNSRISSIRQEGHYCTTSEHGLLNSFKKAMVLMSTCKKNVIPLQDLNDDVHKLNYNG